MLGKNAKISEFHPVLEHYYFIMFNRFCVYQLRLYQCNTIKQRYLIHLPISRIQYNPTNNISQLIQSAQFSTNNNNNRNTNINTNTNQSSPSFIDLSTPSPIIIHPALSKFNGNDKDLIYSNVRLNKFRLYSGLTLLQSGFWAWITRISFIYTDIPMYTGPIGLSCSMLFFLMLSIQSSRSIAAIYLDRTNPNIVTIITHTVLGQLSSKQYSLLDIDNRGLTVVSSRKGTYWAIKLSGFRGHHLIDKDGIIYSELGMRKIVGYGPTFDNINNTATNTNSSNIPIVTPGQSQPPPKSKAASSPSFSLFNQPSKLNQNPLTGIRVGKK